MKARKWFAAVLSAAMVFALGTSALAATVVEKPTVSVSASAEVEAEPDIAYVSLGVRTENKKAEKARKENTDLMTKVIAAVKAQGVAEKDVKTSNLNLYANYTWDKNNKRTLTGYTCDNSLTITVRDVKKVGDVVDAAMQAGANNFNNVRFDLVDSEEYYIQAVAQATKKAMRRAKGVADAAGLTLGKAASLSTNGSGYSPVYDYAEDVAEDAGMDSVANAPAASIGSTIQSGTIKISASVNAVFFLGE